MPLPPTNWGPAHTIDREYRAGLARLDQLHREATWRLNEAEHHLFLGYFDNYWQGLWRNYGERCCAGPLDEIAYIGRWNTITSDNQDIHLGDSSRRAPRF